MTESKRRAPKSLANSRILEVTYDGGTGVEDTFVFHVSLASAAERIALDTVTAEEVAEATKRTNKGKGDVVGAIYDHSLSARARGRLTASERKTYEITFEHVARVEIKEDGESFEAEIVNGKTWGELDFEGRLAWVTQHPGLWAPVLKAILPAAKAEVEGK